MGENALNNAKSNTDKCVFPSLREGENNKITAILSATQELAATLFPRNAPGCAPGHLAILSLAPNSAPSQIAFPSGSNIPEFLKNRTPPQFEKYIIAPPSYLIDLERYFRLLKVNRDETKLFCIGSSLKGHAKYWFDIFKSTFKSYEDFRNRFLTYFWSEDEQEEYKKLVFTEKYQSKIKDESLCCFFDRQLAKSVKLFPDLSFREIVVKLAVKLPNEYATLLIARNAKNVEELGTFIKDLDCLNKYKKIDELSSTKTVKSKRKRLRRRKSKPLYKVECSDLESTSSCKNVNNVQYFYPQNKPVQVWDSDKYYGNVQSTIPKVIFKGKSAVDTEKRNLD